MISAYSVLGLMLLLGAALACSIRLRGAPVPQEVLLEQLDQRS